MVHLTPKMMSVVSTRRGKSDIFLLLIFKLYIIACFHHWGIKEGRGKEEEEGTAAEECQWSLRTCTERLRAQPELLPLTTSWRHGKLASLFAGDRTVGVEQGGSRGKTKTETL